MAFHCMNCNGSMVFDIAMQKMRCLHCDTVCDPEDFVLQSTSRGIEGPGIGSDDSWVESQPGANANSGMAKYTCRSCGAQLESTEDSMIGFCPYCGGQSLVTEASEGHGVESIIPFKVTKDECVESYRGFTRKVRYLPKELRDVEYIRKFTGIYMPFYEYDTKFGNFCLKGSKTVEHNSRYDVEEFYDIEGSIGGTYERGVVFDGSRYLDDEISARTLPYDTAQEKPFVPASLAGFYADTSTVPAELYYEDASSQAQGQMLSSLGKEVSNESGIHVKDSSRIDAKTVGHHSSLFPMWFLTWRKDDRVAYAVINGETGKVVSDLPLDLRSFALGCAAISAILFVVLELLVQPTPLVTSIISLIAALCMGLGIRSGAKQQYERQGHVNDKGWDADAETPKQDKPAPKKGSKLESVKDLLLLGVLLIPGIFLGLAMIDTSLSLLVNFLGPLLCVAALGTVGHVLVKVIAWRRHLSKKDPIIAAVILFVTVILNVAIVIIRPVDDVWYYAGDVICILGLLAASVGMMRAYNLATTRPLPKLFDREEVE